MELGRFYSLDECLNIELIKDKLNSYEREGKIVFNIDRDSLSISDLDLDEKEIMLIKKLFDNNDVIEDLDKSYNDDLDNDLNDYYSDYDNDY